MYVQTHYIYIYKKYIYILVYVKNDTQYQF